MNKKDRGSVRFSRPCTPCNRGNWPDTTACILITPRHVKSGFPTCRFHYEEIKRVEALADTWNAEYLWDGEIEDAG